VERFPGPRVGLAAPMTNAIFRLLLHYFDADLRVMGRFSSEPEKIH